MFLHWMPVPVTRKDSHHIRDGEKLPEFSNQTVETRPMRRLDYSSLEY